MLRASTLAAEGPFRASKWIDLQVLLNVKECEALCSELASMRIFDASGVHSVGDGEIPIADFVSRYASYLQALENGEDAPHLPLNGVWTRDLDALYAIHIDEQRELIKPCLPVIQVQAASLAYSEENACLKPKVFGADCILWGLQFSYPQLFQDPKTQEIVKVDGFPNTELWQTLRRWVRRHTRPTPFLIQGSVVNSPVRVGNESLEWASTHPQLQAQGLALAV